jgi:hypothetical protein
MICKGAARGNPHQLAIYLMRAERYDNGEEIEVLDFRSPWAAGDLSKEEMVQRVIEAFRDWQDSAEATKQGRDGLYRSEINPAPEYAKSMTRAEFLLGADMMEEELGFQGQDRFVVRHAGKDGRTHIHVVWCRTDLDTMKMIPDSYNYAAHERASKRMELEFGHDFVPGKHAKRDRRKQPEFPRQKFDYAEAQMAARSGLTPDERKEQFGAMKAAAANGLELKKALEDAGYVLAQGDRGYLVVDEAGVHSVLSRNIGLKKAETEKFMQGVPLEGLPSVEQAQATQEAKARSAQPLEAPAEPTELTAADRKHQITALREQADSAQAFKNALEEAGYVLAHGPRKGFYIVDEKGEVFNLSSHTGISGKEYKDFMAPIDPAGVPDVDQAKALQKEHATEAAKPGPEASKFLPVAAEQKTPEIPPPPAPTSPPPPPTIKAIDFFKHSGIPKEKQDEIKSKFVKPAEPEKAPEPVKAQPQPPVEPVPPPLPMKVEQPPAPPVPEPPALPAKPAAKEQIAEAETSKFLPPKPAPQPEKVAPPAPPAEDPELVAFRKAIAERQAEENQKLIQKQEQEYKQRDAELAQFNLNSLAGFDAVQRAQMKSLIRRQNEKPTGWKAMMDAAKDAADPLRAAAKAKEQQRARDELKAKHQEERQRYWDIIQESKRVELENFRNRHALQRGDLDRTHEEEEDQLLREREEARKLQAEIEREQREELEKSQGFKHGPPGKGK